MQASGSAPKIGSTWYHIIIIRSWDLSLSLLLSSLLDLWTHYPKSEAPLKVKGSEMCVCVCLCTHAQTHTNAHKKRE
jgi:hypothetical protein